MSTPNPGGPQAPVVCPTCGRQLPSGAKFCGFDGTRITRATQTVETAVAQRPPAEEKICPVCSVAYPAYAVFCSVDGGRLVPARPAQAAAQARGSEIDEDEMVPATELIGQIVGGKYLLEEFIGEGGMAVVYRATHVNMERPVVVKILQGRLSTSEKSVQRFERECKVTAKVSHPNVVSVFDVGFINGNQPYLVMEYIKGESLRDKIDREGQLPLNVAAAILIQICRGLQEAHSMGIIHRDLKPENILLQERSDRPDWVKIVDFGIAHLSSAGYQRLTKTGSVVGTAEYMAPEQLRDFPLDTRSDLYSLGVMLFEMLTARVPFEADTLEAMLLKAIMDPPDPPSKFRQDIPAGSPFDRVVLRAMEKDPDRRYQTATEMRLDVEQIYNQLMLYRRV
ncbi:MAG TPA: serine/threonine-protein kinase [Candidatus Obscuribacterales bacterium]